METSTLTAGRPRLFFGPRIEHRSRFFADSSAERRVVEGVSWVGLAIALAVAGSIEAGAFADNVVVERYVAEALDANREQRQRALAVASSEADVAKAWGGFLPSLGLEARYSIVSGNALDLGRLVNPAYAALNQLLGQQAFPTIDARLPLTQETRLRLSQPLFALELLRNLELREHLSEAERAELARARRALAAEVRRTYLDWAKLARVVALYDETLVVLDEGLRTTRALVDAGKLTDDATLVIDAERAELVQKKLEAERDRRLVGELLNFLRAAPLDAELELSTATVLPDAITVSLGDVGARVADREELRAIDAGIAAQGSVADLASARFWPTLGVAVDYGVQGQRYSFTDEDDLLIVSFVAQWNLFRGFQDQADRQKAELEQRKLALRRAEVEAQLTLDARRAVRAFEVTREALAAAEARTAAARAAFDRVKTRHALGAASQLELVDARTRLTTAELNLTLTTYDRQLRWVDLTRAAAIDPAI